MNAANPLINSGTYQVLARKWRPRNFEQLIGQEHVTRALSHALDNNRLHHAYLFTGTRGIGKTTIARIIAKCLNCEQGISRHPCGSCYACISIDQGNFADLIEVDAASRTKVEDTRELLENVQYLPSQGQYKVYLIDEVHMLSGHSFNALLKTLEEPPPHVKFLLATTDPKKLPITVLSRCLQFHLKQLPPEKIASHLRYILEQESLSAEEAALLQLGKAADGSMRDALSLLDQAIAYGNGQVILSDVNAMLGITDQDCMWRIIQALASNEAQGLVDCCHALAEDAADFTLALEELLTCFHQIALEQALSESTGSPLAAQYAKLIPGEELQLYYQIGLIGRRDLPLAPSARIGFEMVLLRMLSYRPTSTIPVPQPPARMDSVEIAQNEQASVEQPNTENSAGTAHTDSSAHDWASIVAQLKLTGISHTLAMHCVLQSLSENNVQLLLDPTFSALLNPNLQQKLNEALNQHLGKTVKLVINTGTSAQETPAIMEKNRLLAQKEATLSAIHNDPGIQHLVKNFDATIELSTLKLKES